MKFHKDIWFEMNIDNSVLSFPAARYKRVRSSTETAESMPKSSKNVLGR